MAAQPTPAQLVGQRVKRREDPRLIRGQATYVDDMKLTGMLHAAFKRGEIAHGKIVKIDKRAAEAMPGVELVLTGAELKELLAAPMPVISPLPTPAHWPLTPDKVRYVGDPVAVVVASDRYSARDAVDAIEVELEELPAVVDPELALEGKPTLVHDDFPNNTAIARIAGGTDADRATG
ncbi:MAG: xanthine dehydrogenase family protein molybdopterin-binding subunit, partial [Dehalococcoidia bacterium]